MIQCDCMVKGAGEPQYDGYGIFLCYTCPKCHKQKMERYRHDIKERYETDDQIEPDE